MARHQLGCPGHVPALNAADLSTLLTDDRIADLYARTEGNALLLTLAIDGLKRTVDPARFLDNLLDDPNIERFLIKEIHAELNRRARRDDGDRHLAGLWRYARSD